MDWYEPTMTIDREAGRKLERLALAIIKSDLGWAMMQAYTGLTCTRRQYLKASRKDRERMLRRAARRRQ